MKKFLLLFSAALLLSSMAFADKQKRTIDITAESLAGQKGWENGLAYLVVQLDNNITLLVDTNKAGQDQSGVYYQASGTSAADWRIYQARTDSFWVEAANGALIDSVQLTYANKNNGTLSTKKGINVDASYRIASDSVLYVGGVSKVCLYAASTKANVGNGQVRISRFRIFYRCEKQCTLTLKSNDESGADDIIGIATVGETSPFEGKALFTRPGYSISKGYWKDPITEVAGTRLVNTTGKFTTNVGGYTDANQKWVCESEEDITLYAHWAIKNYKITYANMDGATNFEDAPATYTIETSTITLGTPTKTGYTFAGWKANNAEGTTVTEIALGSVGDTTLWATWTAHKTTVHFIANGGDATATFDTVVEYGTRKAILSAEEVTSKLTRENYTFNNYYTSAEGGLRMTNVTNAGNLFFIQGAREGYLDTDGKWIKDGGEATFYAHWTLTTLVLNEEEDNSAMLRDGDGKTVDVSISRSTLVAGVWNSLCLPFDINKSYFGTAQVVKMTGAELKNDVIGVAFDDVTEEELTAGTPYLVKPAAAVALTNFSNKVIKAKPDTVGDNDYIQLVGIYSPVALTANDKTKLFLAQPDTKGNNLFFASQDGSLKGMRAYFNILAQESGSPIRLGRMVFNTTSGVVDVNENVNVNQKMIVNGQLIIIRNGVCYNANGQMIKINGTW